VKAERARDIEDTSGRESRMEGDGKGRAAVREGPKQGRQAAFEAGEAVGFG
jgi:hypothetical protein